MDDDRRENRGGSDERPGVAAYAPVCERPDDEGMKKIERVGRIAE
jgi:hypothetical protein